MVEPVEWAYENIVETASKGQLSSMADYLARKALTMTPDHSYCLSLWALSSIRFSWGACH
ncbi:hypothetical protein SK128_026854 [Halocaridina rubra]|uniref:Uncharacterized protein n=1 Tax=Halocaridina rubra TaxID=373956 RepID=A0AAN8W8M3_HALRR